MADSTIVRLVDEQRSQIRWLNQFAAERAGSDAVAQQALVCAGARALHVCLTGYFAELTQPRFDRALWPKLLACQGSFEAMVRVANVPSSMVAEWLAAERDDSTAQAIALQLVARANEPATSGYRSGLLSSTSLNEAADSGLIASSARAPLILSFATLMPIVNELEDAIGRQRAQNLEC